MNYLSTEQLECPELNAAGGYIDSTTRHGWVRLYVRDGQYEKIISEPTVLEGEAPQPIKRLRRK